MTEDMFGFAGFTAFFIMIAAWIAAYRGGRLAYSRSSRQLQGRTLRLTALLGAAGLLVAVKTIGIIINWPTGYHAFETKLLLDLALLLVPGAAVLTLAVPRLVQLRAAAKGEHRLNGIGASGRLNSSLRGQSADPLLVVPIQAAGWGAAAVFYLTYFTSVPLSPSELVLTPVLVAAVILIFWIRQGWRHRSMQVESWYRPGAGRRALWAALSTVVVAGLITGSLVTASTASRLPDRVDMMNGPMDYGGGVVPANGVHGHDAHDSSGAVSVADLTGPHTGEANKQFTLTASKKTVKLDSGTSIEAWTFNGGVPGPEIRVKQGDLVEIKLINQDIEEGVTIHMHGVDLPNAEDGVAGVTQDAVLPDQSFTYRFVAEDAGTYWYHSHQETLQGEGKGLFGAFIVEPSEQQPANTADIAVLAHTWESTDNVQPIISFGSADQQSTRIIQAGTPVRLRLINTDINEKRFRLSGTTFQVAAIDGTDLNEPGELKDQDLLLAAGGRYDVTFVMPSSPVTLTSHHDNASDGGGQMATMTMSSDGASGTVPNMKDSQPLFDPLSYGEPAEVPFGADSTFDRDFTLVLGQKLSFYDGRFAYALTINGKVFPDTPMLMVREGDLVRTTFINHSSSHHPMHLHGHHMLVLSRNGIPSNGSPWWTDTLDVAPGDTYTVAFRADNPGVWMDHCHNLFHAAVGMMMHLAYEGVTSPFAMGRGTVNHPE